MIVIKNLLVGASDISEAVPGNIARCSRLEERRVATEGDGGGNIAPSAVSRERPLGRFTGGAESGELTASCASGAVCEAFTSLDAASWTVFFLKGVPRTGLRFLPMMTRADVLTQPSTTQD